MNSLYIKIKNTSLESKSNVFINDENTVYSDKEIAEKFGVYSESDPIWNKFSGIDTNVPLLATYVISPTGQIEYDHIDSDFSKTYPSKAIISTVQKSDPLVRNINNKFNRQVDYYRGRAH